MSEQQRPPQAPTNAEYDIRREDVSLLSKLLDSLEGVKYDPSHRFAMPTPRQYYELNNRAQSVIEMVDSTPETEKGRQALFSGAAYGLARDASLKKDITDVMIGQNILNPEEVSILHEYNQRLMNIQRGARDNPDVAGYNFSMEVSALLDHAYSKIDEGSATHGLLLSGLALTAVQAPAQHHEQGALQAIASRYL